VPNLLQLIHKGFPPENDKRGRTPEPVTLAARAIGVTRQSLYACVHKNKLSAQMAADIVRTSEGRIAAEDVVPFLDKTVLDSYRFLLGRPKT